MQRPVLGSKDDFLLCLVTVDETWVHYYEPANKSHESSVRRVCVPEPKEVKIQSSAGKVMATVF